MSSFGNIAVINNNASKRQKSFCLLFFRSQWWPPPIKIDFSAECYFAATFNSDLY